MPNWLIDGLTDVAILLAVFVVSWGIYVLVSLWYRTPSTPPRATVHPIRPDEVFCDWGAHLVPFASADLERGGNATICPYCSRLRQRDVESFLPKEIA